MSYEWELKIEKVVADRQTILPPKQMKRFLDGEYNPFYSLVKRGNELLCINTTGRIKPVIKDCVLVKGGDEEICRFCDPERGFRTSDDSDSGLSWGEVVVDVMKAMGAIKPEKQMVFRE